MKELQARLIALDLKIENATGSEKMNLMDKRLEIDRQLNPEKYSCSTEGDCIKCGS